MATQHPDNAGAPPWEHDGDGFVSVREEPAECMWCYRTLGVHEFMWDWEGKHADEAVIDKFFSHYHSYFKRRRLGKDIFLTFRIPNIWQERGYHLIRALMVILTSEDFARDIRFHAPPLFEVILPMTERADQLIYIQRSFRDLARFKTRTFTVHEHTNLDYLHIIPLIEGVEQQMHIDSLLTRYLALHKKNFGRAPSYMRPFLARSDPALVSGLVATVLANKIALGKINDFSRTTKIPMHPIIGVGSLIFRGGLSPKRVRAFLQEYRGIRTVTMQSSFRYDYPQSKVRKAISVLAHELPRNKSPLIAPREYIQLEKIVAKFARTYRTTLEQLVPFMQPFFNAVPPRRERRQHIGFLAYTRSMGRISLPRAINFTAAFYSIGIPPEFIGTGRVWHALNAPERALVQKYYINMRADLIEAGHYLNRHNLTRLAARNAAWKTVLEDVQCLERMFGITFGPKSSQEQLHMNCTSNVVLLSRSSQKLSALIAETGLLRMSLG